MMWRLIRGLIYFGSLLGAAIMLTDGGVQGPIEPYIVGFLLGIMSGMAYIEGSLNG